MVVGPWTRRGGSSSYSEDYRLEVRGEGTTFGHAPRGDESPTSGSRNTPKVLGALDRRRVERPDQRVLRVRDLGLETHKRKSVDFRVKETIRGRGTPEPWGTVPPTEETRIRRDGRK